MMIIMSSKDKAVMGRPKKQIDQKVFEELCQIQCTRNEICAVLDVTDKTLSRWCKETYDVPTFSAVYQAKALNGVTSKRRQFFKSENPMLIALWLKNHAGIKDRTEVESTNKIEVVSDVPKV